MRGVYEGGGTPECGATIVDDCLAYIGVDVGFRGIVRTYGDPGDRYLLYVVTHAVRYKEPMPEDPSLARSIDELNVELVEKTILDAITRMHQTLRDNGNESKITEFNAKIADYMKTENDKRPVALDHQPITPSSPIGRTALGEPLGAFAEMI